MLKIYYSKSNNLGINSSDFTKRILSSFLGIDKKGIIIEKTKFGKPYLKDYPNIHFNLSHTKGVTVFALSDKEVGIDIERIKKFNERIPIKFFSNNEQNYIFQKNEGQKTRFHEIWTRKEAYVKWLGIGMRKPFNSFDVLENKKITTLYLKDYIVSICSDTKYDIYKGLTMI